MTLESRVSESTVDGPAIIDDLPLPGQLHSVSATVESCTKRPMSLKTPQRILFIASIGNPRPYRSTRHSAGHILLDALTPLLAVRMPLTSSQHQSSSGPLFYKTYLSPSYMNESGPKLVRQLKNWLSTTQTDIFERIVRPGFIRDPTATTTPTTTTTTSDSAPKTTHPEWHRRGTDPSTLKHLPPTLIILHDELESPLGKVRVKRGGPDQASLRGHRGLISVFESLRGKGLYPARADATAAHGELSVLRIGVGIGRPETRGRGDVAKYVLTEMSPKEVAAVRGAAGQVVDVLADEFYWEGDSK
ncbi:aminoacyl-tRNA hydrolase [Aspergillus candidus]|uniref:Peptidyl-tRNA hydrolase n=1 Tax=Aspergillus candidus TaxID=41067 RepID=A0A2I2F251_ASPCN|nr:hypothetical protein BDW47DRAFT_120150 [Aspergillus candidus]PLB34699.1 hypothetical protein BDW47DRAFT_120150 [Aspergillus candidus]